MEMDRSLSDMLDNQYIRKYISPHLYIFLMVILMSLTNIIANNYIQLELFLIFLLTKVFERYLNFNRTRIEQILQC